MIRILAIFLSLLLVAEAQQPATLRVVSWNLQWFPGGHTGATKEEQEKHISAVREEIRKLRPDILLLQEVGSAAALEETLKPLGPEWRVAIVSRFTQGNFLSGQQLAIAARIPAESAWAEPWANSWAQPPRGYAYASFLIGTKRLAIYCLHLKSNLGNPSENTSKREDAMEQLVAHLQAPRRAVPTPDAIIIGGDFNTDDPDTPAGQAAAERTFNMLRAQKFSWAFDGVRHENRITCPGKGRYPDASFDHFFTRGLNRPLARVVPATASDHRPVVMDIAIP
jgi:endonuclease/exonuclease/phosphatase family metal-dependent hydrolase